jgi:hypothetical protein
LWELTINMWVFQVIDGEEYQMRKDKWMAWLAAAVGLAMLGCGSGDDGADLDAGLDAGGDTDGDSDTFDLGNTACLPENGPFTPDIDNPYLPFTVGSIHRIEGLEGGTEYGCYRIVVPGDTAEVGGVTARVVEKHGCEDGGVDEAEIEYFAQALDGTVCIFGEEGAWEAGQDGYEAGLFMPGAPAVGMVFVEIHKPDGVETGEITELAVPFETPAGLLDDTMTVMEEDSEEVGVSLKRYARDIGEIYDDGMTLVSY